MNPVFILKAIMALPTILRALDGLGRLIHEYGLEKLFTELNAHLDDFDHAKSQDDKIAAVRNLSDVVNRLRGCTGPANPNMSVGQGRVDVPERGP